MSTYAPEVEKPVEVKNTTSGSAPRRKAKVRRGTSIAFRLITAVLAVELLSAALVILLAWGYERHAHFRAFDVMLRGRADSVLGAVQDAEDVGDNVMLDLRDVHIPPDDAYEVWDGRGHLLGRSDNWQGSAGMVAPTADGITRLELHGRPYGMLRLSGSRIVDPGERGGGHLRPVTILYAAPTGPVWHAIRGAVEFYALGSLALVLVTGPLIAWLLHRGLAPLRELATLAEGVSAEAWAFDPPKSARTTPELAPLTEALQSVLERLELSFNQQKMFVSDAAHELKTAVAVTKSSLQLLALKPRSPGEYKVGLDRCLADSERMEQLVTKMLTLARVENAGAAATAEANCDLAACAKTAAAHLETMARLRNVTVEMKADGTCAAPLTFEDGTMLIENLLLNAVQHSQTRTTVELTVTAHRGMSPGDRGTALVVVQDHGAGISAEALPLVFERFYRGDASRSRATGGAGLGLAICKALVEKAGGTIELTSEVGVGTTATVKLPGA